MRFRSCLLISALALAGCAYEEPAPVATTTTVTREVTTTGPVTGEVLVTQAPPAPRVEVQTVAPGPGYAWTPGYWRWTGTDYVWTSGSWVVRPRASAIYVRGHWERRPGGWVWIPGHF